VSDNSENKGTDELEASRAPLMDHLIELRGRMMRAMAAFVVAFVICYIFAAEIYAILVQPLAGAVEGQEGRRLIFTALQETFFTYVKVAAFGALCLSFPYLALQLWAFTAPGLYRNEKRAFLPFLIASPVLFIAGASLVYFVVMPLAVQFFLGFETGGGAGRLPIELEARVSEYLGLIMTLMFAFGLCFQLPVLLTLMARAGLVSAAFLRRNRKYAIVLVFIVAAFLTPPDPVSQIGLGLPVLLLYELSIFLVARTERRRRVAPAGDDGEPAERDAETAS
jgi:sec-independent protein translocase protein TatC